MELSATYGVSADDVPKTLPSQLKYEFNGVSEIIDVEINVETQGIIWDQNSRASMSKVINDLWNPRKIELDLLKSTFGDFKIDNAHKMS